MKKYLFLFSFLFYFASSNLSRNPSGVSWSLVDENCGINEEKIIEDRILSQMEEKNGIINKIKDQFLSGATNSYSKTVCNKIKKNDYKSLWQLKSDLTSLGYDIDGLGINLNNVDIGNVNVSQISDLVGENFCDKKSDFQSFATSKDAIGEICRTQTLEKCSNSLTSNIDTERLNAGIQACTAERTRGTVEMDTKTETGTDIVGCFVMPGMGVAPPVPMYPFMANNSSIYWTNYMHPGCQCGMYPCPMGTPIVVPHITSDTGAETDIRKMAGISGCYSEVFADIAGEQFTSCMTNEEDICKQNLEKKMRDVRETAIEVYKESADKCMIKKEAFEKEFKDEVKRDLEGVKTPNGTVIKNGVIVNDPESGKGDKEFIFQLDNEDFKKITVNLTQCKSLLPYIDNSETLKRMEEWCDNYTTKVTNIETLDLWIQDELRDLTFEKLYYLKVWKLDLIDKTDGIRRGIIRDKYMDNYEYDMSKVLQYAEEAPEIMMSVKEIQNMMRIEYRNEYQKHLLNIEQKYKEYRIERKLIEENEEKEIREERALFEIQLKEEREKKNKIKNLSPKEKEKLELLEKIEKLKNNK